MPGATVATAAPLHQVAKHSLQYVLSDRSPIGYSLWPRLGAVTFSRSGNNMASPPAAPNGQAARNIPFSTHVSSRQSEHALRNASVPPCCRRPPPVPDEPALSLIPPLVLHCTSCAPWSTCDNTPSLTSAPLEPRQARGVPLFDRGRFFDLPRNTALALLELRDISSALFWFLSCQTYLTLWSFLITLISGKPHARGLLQAPARPPNDIAHATARSAAPTLPGQRCIDGTKCARSGGWRLTLPGGALQWCFSPITPTATARSWQPTLTGCCSARSRCCRRWASCSLRTCGGSAALGSWPRVRGPGRRRCASACQGGQLRQAAAAAWEGVLVYAGFRCGGLQGGGAVGVGGILWGLAACVASGTSRLAVHVTPAGAAWLRPAAAKVLMLSLFTAHRDWVADAQRPKGHMEAVQVRLRMDPWIGIRRHVAHAATSRCPRRARGRQRCSGPCCGLPAASRLPARLPSGLLGCGGLLACCCV